MLFYFGDDFLPPWQAWVTLGRCKKPSQLWDAEELAWRAILDIAGGAETEERLRKLFLEDMSPAQFQGIDDGDRAWLSPVCGSQNGPLVAGGLEVIFSSMDQGQGIDPLSTYSIPPAVLPSGDRLPLTRPQEGAFSPHPQGSLLTAVTCSLQRFDSLSGYPHSDRRWVTRSGREHARNLLRFSALLLASGLFVR